MQFAAYFNSIANAQKLLENGIVEASGNEKERVCYREKVSQLLDIANNSEAAALL